MPGLRDLKRRIKGIQGMRKVTRAMQMVSAAKMRKAQDAVVNSRAYASLAQELIMSVKANLDDSNTEGGERQTQPLLQTFPRATKVGVILLTTNRGLVGSLNTNLQPKIRELGNHTDVITEITVYGKYAKSIAGKMGKHIMADFIKNERKVTSEDIYPIAGFITEAYKTGKYKEIVIIYNHFVSTLVQRPMVKKLLPFTDTTDEFPKQEPESNTKSVGFGSKNRASDYLFEPTPQAVFDALLPKIIESQIYEAVLESDASEHSARMVMMKNATEAAGDLIDHYTLTYNQLRQNKITTELAEITAGKIALE